MPETDAVAVVGDLATVGFEISPMRRLGQNRPRPGECVLMVDGHIYRCRVKNKAYSRPRGIVDRGPAMRQLRVPDDSIAGTHKQPAPRQIERPTSGHDTGLVVHPQLVVERGYLLERSVAAQCQRLAVEFA